MGITGEKKNGDSSAARNTASLKICPLTDRFTQGDVSLTVSQYTPTPTLGVLCTTQHHSYDGSGGAS